jgi:hypothetical protein
MRWAAFVRFPLRKETFPPSIQSRLALLSNGYQVLFPPEETGTVVKLFVHLHLVSRLRKVEICLHSLTCLHCLVLKYKDNITLFNFINFVNYT